MNIVAVCRRKLSFCSRLFCESNLAFVPDVPVCSNSISERIVVTMHGMTCGIPPCAMKPWYFFFCAGWGCEEVYDRSSDLSIWCLSLWRFAHQPRLLQSAEFLETIRTPHEFVEFAEGSQQYPAMKPTMAYRILPQAILWESTDRASLQEIFGGDLARVCRVRDAWLFVTPADHVHYFPGWPKVWTCFNLIILICFALVSGWCQRPLIYLVIQAQMSSIQCLALFSKLYLRALDIFSQDALCTLYIFVWPMLLVPQAVLEQLQLVKLTTGTQRLSQCCLVGTGEIYNDN